jgi:hypothetical protein
MSYLHFMYLTYAGWLYLFLILTVFWWRPLFGNRLFTSVEVFFSRIAAHKRTAILAAILIPILFRVSILKILPIRPAAVVDEYSYLLAGDTFAHGRITNPPHPMSVFFDTIFVLQHPTYASMYPPAQGAALAVGELLGNPWFGVLLSMGLMFGALVWMLQGWFPPRWAFLGAAIPFLKFGTFSYWMNGYWGGAVAAIGGALVMGALPRIVRKQKVSDALLMGLGIAILANSRPYEGLLLCIPVAFALISWLFSRRSPSWRITLPRVILPVTAFVLLTVAFCGYYNWRITGNPLLFPHTLHESQYETVRSFVWQSPLPPMHYNNTQFETAYTTGPRNEFRHTWADYPRVVEKKFTDFYLFFLGPALLVPFITIPLLFTNRRMTFFLFQFSLYCAGALVVIWSQPHYAAPLLGTFLILLTQMFRYLRRWLHLGRPVGIGLTRGLILFSAAAIPIYSLQVIKEPHGCFDYSWGHSNWERGRITNELTAIPGQHLVIVRYSRTHHDVSYEWVNNDADIDHAKIVWARGIPGLDTRPLLDYYKGRKVWLVNPDSDPAILSPYASPGPETPPQH